MYPAWPGLIMNTQKDNRKIKKKKNLVWIKPMTIGSTALTLTHYTTGQADGVRAVYYVCGESSAPLEISFGLFRHV